MQARYCACFPSDVALPTPSAQVTFLNSNQRLYRFLKRLIRYRGWLFLVGMVLAVGAGVAGRGLQLDRSIEHMFADDDPILKPYRELQQTFGQHEIVLAVYSETQLSSEAGLGRVGRLSKQIGEVPGVVAAVSLLDPPGAADFEDKGRGARLREVFSGYTHNDALDAVAIICLLKRPTADAPPRGETLRQLRALMEEYPGGTIVGEPVLVDEAFDLLEADGRRLNTWCTVLLMLTIFVCFRSLRWLLLPLVVVQMTLALTRGTLVLLGLQLSMVSSMLSAIVTVVGVAAVVHVIVRFRDAQSQGRAPASALLQSGQILVAPIFFACLTDAAGFAALMTSGVGPVKDFGLMMGIGSLMVLVSVLLVTPAIVLVGRRRTISLLPSDGGTLRQALQHLLDWSTRRARLLAVLIGLMTVGAGIGSTQLVRETDFTRNFREDSHLVSGYQFVEDKFGGAGVWDILVTVPRRVDKKFLQSVLAFEKHLLKDVPHLNKAISIADILDAGTGGLRKINMGATLAIRSGISVMRGRMPEFVNAIFYRGEKGKRPQLRVMLRSSERLTAAEKTQMIEQVRQEAEKAFPGSQVTGYYVLLTKLIDSLLRDQWITFGVGAVVILVVMALAFRSFILAIATLVPNALPILLLFGAMGWLGVPVNMGAAMIAAVSLGLSVDGSIHYVMSYQRERRKSTSIDEALHLVQATVGRAAVLATLALVVGFATLCYSDFVPTIYFGVLVSLSMIGGLVGNLMVLPLLIRKVEKALGAEKQ